MTGRPAQGLALEGISVAYGRRTVLSRLDVPSIPPGSVVAVVGPNAAGKSTLLKAVAGLVRAEGRAVFDGVDLMGLGVARRIRAVGYLPQHLPPGTSLTAYETTLSACRAAQPDLPRREIEAAIERAFARLGLADVAFRRLGELSSGQRQMVGLAQIVARRPRLLLLDEPTSALDLRWQMATLDAVRDMATNEGAVALVALHDLNLALRFADRAIVLANGGLLIAGAPETALDAAFLREAYGVEGRIEKCSRGIPVVLVDRVTGGMERREL